MNAKRLPISIGLQLEKTKVEKPNSLGSEFTGLMSKFYWFRGFGRGDEEGARDVIQVLRLDKLPQNIPL